MTMRVVHIIGGLGVGGAEGALLKTVEAFAGSDIECQVFSMGAGESLATRFEATGVKLTCFDFTRSPLRAMWNLYRALREAEPDVVQTWLYHADLAGGLAARAAGCRAILWGIRSVGLARDAKLATRMIMKAGAWLSHWVPARILCVATASKEAHGALGYDLRKMVVVPNGYDLTKMVPSAGARSRLRAAWGIGADERVIGTVGRFCDEKDYPTFVQASARIAAERGDVQFVMIGRGLDPSNPALLSWIRERGLEGRVRLLGSREDVVDCLSAFDLFCLPSRMEAFPNVLVEAMAAGLPCVSTDAGDAAEILGECGLVVPREQPDRLAGGMRSLLALPAPDRESLGELAKARVRSKYSLQESCRLMQEIYLDLLRKDV